MTEAETLKFEKWKVADEKWQHILDIYSAFSDQLMEEADKLTIDEIDELLEHGAYFQFDAAVITKNHLRNIRRVKDLTQNLTKGSL